MCKTAIFFGKELADYGFGISHPFNSNRIYSFWSKFSSLNLHESSKITIENPSIASEHDLLEFHNKNYIDVVKEYSKHGLDIWIQAILQLLKGFLKHRLT